MSFEARKISQHEQIASDMRKELDNRQIPTDPQSNFKILLAGGFSQYIGVEILVREAFGTRSDDTTARPVSMNLQASQ